MDFWVGWQKPTIKSEVSLNLVAFKMLLGSALKKQLLCSWKTMLLAAAPFLLRNNEVLKYTQKSGGKMALLLHTASSRVQIYTQKVLDHHNTFWTLKYCFFFKIMQLMSKSKLLKASLNICHFLHLNSLNKHLNGIGHKPQVLGVIKSLVFCCVTGSVFVYTVYVGGGRYTYYSQY